MAAVLVGEELGQEGVDAVDDAPQADVDDPLPVLEREVLDLAAPAHAGVVAHHVHGTEAVEHCVAQGQHAVGVGDVGAHAHHAELVRSRLQHRRLDVGDHHVHALGREPRGHGLPDPRCATGHDGNLSPNVVHTLDGSEPRGAAERWGRSAGWVRAAAWIGGLG